MVYGCIEKHRVCLSLSLVAGSCFSIPSFFISFADDCCFYLFVCDFDSLVSFGYNSNGIFTFFHTTFSLPLTLSHIHWPINLCFNWLLILNHDEVNLFFMSFWIYIIWFGELRFRTLFSTNFKRKYLLFVFLDFDLQSFWVWWVLHLLSVCFTKEQFISRTIRLCIGTNVVSLDFRFGLITNSFAYRSANI